MNKVGRVKLIRDFFEAPAREVMQLSKDDMAQLGSAIARQMGLKQDDCDFEFVAY